MCSYAGIALAGTAVAAGGQILQGNRQAALAGYQADAYERQAESDRQASEFEISREERAFSIRQGAAVAQIGASGVGAISGSPSQTLAQNASEHALDLEAIRYGSALRQDQYRTQAAITKAGGQAAKTAGYIGAATTALSGTARLFDPTRSVRLGVSPFSSGGYQGGFA